MQRLAVLVCSLALLLGSCPALASCAAAIPLITTIASVVSEVATVLDAVESTVEQRQQDDASKAVLAALGRARAALLVVQSAARGAGSVATGDYARAVDDLLSAYQAVLELARAFGVQAAQRPERTLLGARAGVLLVPTVGELRAGLMQPSEVSR
jgi:hypothetical protein